MHRDPHPVPTSRRRGVAAMEAVLVLPVIFALLALIMYCGVTMLRWHRVASVDRYEAWRSAAYAPGPAAPSERADPDIPVLPGTPTDQFSATPLADAFFPSTTVGSGESQRTVDRYGLESLATRARPGQNTGQNTDPAFTHLFNAIVNASTEEEFALFQALFFGTARPLPGYRAVELDAAFASRFGLSFADNFDVVTSRMDGDWRFVNDALDLEAETFYDLDENRIDAPLYGDPREGNPRPDRIVSISAGVAERTQPRLMAQLFSISSSNPLAGEILNLGRRVPAYLGPEIPDRVAPDGVTLQWDEPTPINTR